MLKKSIIALSIITLLNTAHASRTRERFDEETRTAAAAAHARNCLTEEQEGWWTDYLNSKTPITNYIQTISHTKPEAALWFLTSGGKNGFRETPATSDEATKMFDALKNIAFHFCKPENQEKAKKAWSNLDLTKAGQYHLDLIYDEMDALIAKVETLERSNQNQVIRINALEQRITEVSADNASLKARISVLETKVDDLNDKLQKNLERHKKEMFEAQKDFRAEIIALMQQESSKQNETMAKMFAALELQQTEYQQRFDAETAKIRLQAEADKARLHEVIRENRQEAAERESRVKSQVQEAISRFTTVLLAPLVN
jgi:hypothetical protein